MVFFTFRRAAVVAVALVALSLASCGSSDKHVCHPVSGKVTVKGVPLEGVMVVLHPRDNAKFANNRPIGYTDASGEFKITTYTAGDGAPEGEWAVAVLMKPKDDEGDDQPSSKKKLDWKYARPETSGLKVVVKAGKNVMDPIVIP